MPLLARQQVLEQPSAVMRSSQCVLITGRHWAYLMPTTLKHADEGSVQQRVEKQSPKLEVHVASMGEAGGGAGGGTSSFGQ